MKKLILLSLCLCLYFVGEAQETNPLNLLGNHDFKYVKSTKSAVKGRSLAPQSITPGSTDLISSNNVFLQGQNIEVGVSQWGFFGTTVAQPAGYHGNVNNRLGFVADPKKDNWNGGTPAYNGDYFLPGTPEEGFGVEINGINFGNFGGGTTTIPMTSVSQAFTSNQHIATWNGAVNGLAINQTVKFADDGTYFTIQADLTNTTGSTLLNVYYMRNVDPDNEAVATTNYTTINTIVYQPTTDVQNRALVSAVGQTYGMYLGLAAVDSRARVTYGGFSNRSASDVWNGTGLSQSGTFTTDNAISLSFDLGSIAAGETKTVQYSYILDATQVNAAISALSSISVNAISSTTVSLNAIATTNGTGYYIIVPQSSTPPTATQIKAGINYSGVTIINSGSSAMTANTNHVFSITGLTQGTNYDVYFVTQDASNVFTSVNTTSFVTASNVATLAALTSSSGTLSPTFATTTTDYTVGVTNATGTLTVTPTKTDANSTIQVQVNSGGYTDVASGSASGSLALNVGSNTINIKVTAQDGTTTSIYTITVNRAGLPTITSFTPTTGATGATVTITGTNLTETSGVSIGGTSASSVTVIDANTVTAVVTCGTTGTISLTTPDGTAVSAGTFTYIPAPTITSFTPTTAASGATITITGTNLTGATTVSIGGTSASSVTVIDANTVTAVVASGSTGTISLTTPDGTAVSAGTFTYIPAPTITSFTPTTAASGATVTITGTNLTGTSAVSIGGTAASSFTVVTSTSVTAVVASGSTGTISLTTPGGSAESAGTFTFIPAPTITSFTPTTGATGATVTITGTNLTETSGVSIGGTSASSVTVVDVNTVTAVVSSGTSGTISLTTPGGTAISANTFIYIPAPTISSFSPTNGCNGTTVTITGTDFTSATAVSFGGNSASSFTVVNPTTITAIYGSGTTGKIAISTPGGTVSSNANFSEGSIATYAYIANSNSNTVSVINTATNTVTETVAVGNHPAGISISPDGSKVYVGNWGNNNVSVINTTNNTVTATIGLVSAPRAISISPDGSKVYAVIGNNTVNVIDAASNTVTSTIALGNGPDGISVSPDGSKVYVVNTGNDNVSVINTANNTVTGTVSTGAGSSPHGIIVSPDGHKIFVANSGNNTVSVINTANNTLTSTVAVGSFPYGINISPDGTKVYVTNSNSNTVSVINTDNNTITATVDVGSYPWGICISPDGSKVYVTNYSDNTVSVINTVSNTVSSTLTVGSGPASYGNFISNIVIPCVSAEPVISGFTPTTGASGTTVTITGTNLTGSTAVSFGGTPASSYTVMDANTISAVIGSGATGTVSISTQGGTAISGNIFTYIPTPVNATNITITFSGSGASNSVGDVLVQNLTQGTSVIVPSGNTLYLYDVPSQINQPNENKQGITIYQNAQQANNIVSFFSKQAGMAQIFAFGVDGKLIKGINQNLQVGENSYELTLPKGAYVIRVAGNGYSYSAKLINPFNLPGITNITYIGNQKPSEVGLQKSKSDGVTSMLYTGGDLLLYTAVSGNYSTVATDSPSADKTTNFNFVACQDADGNNYKVLTIGTQTWMAENLKTTHYQNGETIANFTDGTAWLSTNEGAWCDYSNLAIIGTKYGHLYNWFATTDSRKIAPFGWHVATDAEWATLTDYSGGGGSAGGKLKESGATNWVDTGATNETGFTALPGGGRYSDGNFYYLSHYGVWWSSSSLSNTQAWYWDMASFDNTMTRGSDNKTDGISVRCIKNTATLPTLTTADITLQNNNTASGGGNISSDGGAAVTVRGLCWGTTSSPTIDGFGIFTTSDGTGTGAFVSSLSALNLNQNYYVRAYATNSEGTAYGNEVMFMAQAFPPAQPTTNVITAITSSTATGGGSFTTGGNVVDIMGQGICWSTSPNPTIYDSKTNDVASSGSFTSSLTGLLPATTYYVRSYISTYVSWMGFSGYWDPVTYGNEVSFTTSPAAPVMAIGDLYLGGKIAYLDESGIHGFVCTLTDQSTSATWWNGSFMNIYGARNDGLETTGVYGISKSHGRKNTDAIIAAQGAGTYAASICAALTIGGATAGDWYLPSYDELNQIYVNKTILGGFSTYEYWSSYDYDPHFALSKSFLDGQWSQGAKTSKCYVRAIRAF